MKPILETERLLLRELNVGDAISFYELNLNPNVIRHTGDSSFENIEAAVRFLQNYKDYETNGYGRWAVIEKESGAFLGWCGLKLSKETLETDIGFRFFEHHWNKGYATESASACLDYGFEKLGLKSIVGRAMADNISSVKVLEKLGLVFEKEFDFDGYRGVIYRMDKENFIL